jgi:putative N6-adenine-specific DNA methylase
MSEVRYPCAAAASFGLESLVRSELDGLGISGARAEDRRVLFDATAGQIATCNIGLRAADRVLLRAADFPAAGFDAVYEGVRAVRWRDLLPPRASVVVHARSVKSRLTAVPSLQSVTKKAIVDALAGGRGGAHARLDESGPRCDVELALKADQASLTLDTTGPGLHRRGYRTEAGEAPLRENLAAALVMLSRWGPGRPFADPLCGSGTIAIEAALAAAGIAPGLRRTFAAESLPLVPAREWAAARERARAAERRDVEVVITGSDRDARVIGAAGRNARAAGVEGLVRFRAAPLSAFRADGEYGCIVCNPPYGERLGTGDEAQELCRQLGETFRGLPTWSLFALSAAEDFERHFGARSSRNRKLYNGNIRCWLYQYFGPMRPHRPATPA